MDLRHALLRYLLTPTFALALAGCGPSVDRPEGSSSVAPDQSAGTEAIRALETRFEAEVGISALDTGDQSTFEYRADARFGYASTLKLFMAAEFLRVVAPADRDELVTWSRADVEASGYSPVTEASVENVLTLAQLTEAAVRQSNNTATNLVLDRIGGPAGLEAALRQLGDDTSEVVNREPALNDVEPGTTDDTTTPAAFTANLAAYLDGSVLDDRDRATLVDWMSDNATGDSLVRAGAPAGWVVADKSGGAGAMRNDVAVVTPPDRDPIILTILTRRTDPTAEYDDELVARAAAVALEELG